MRRRMLPTATTGTLLSLLLAWWCLPVIDSWTVSSCYRHCGSLVQPGPFSTCIFSSSSNDKDNEASQLRRISIAGMSVSENGFWVVLQVSSNHYWPVQVTCSNEDTAQATSLESLTLLQLVSGVDMAGPLLPPERLAQLAVIYAEDYVGDNEALSELLDQVNLPQNQESYSELNDWQRSRTRLPQVTLDEVVMDRINAKTTRWKLLCRSPKITGSFDIVLLSSSEHDDTSAAFTSMALALRYQAPLLLQQNDDTMTLLSLDQIQSQFPLYKNLADLRKPADRAQSNLERGFEYHKLTGALKVAMERGDELAAKRIREALEKYDSLDDLPTIEPTDFDQLQ